MPYVLCIAGIFCLIFSTFALYHPDFSGIDLQIVEWMRLQRTEAFNRICSALSVIGGMPFVLLLTTLWCIYLVWYKKYASIIFICAGMCGVILLVWLLKFLFARTRPPEYLHMVDSVGGSFPSAHSSYAACLACLSLYVYLQHPRRNMVAVYAMLWLLVMGISRVYLGVHYPSDVLAGWSISFIWVSCLYLILIRYNTLANKKI